MSNLYKRGGIWWGRAVRAGREYRRSLRTGDRSEAKRRLKLWQESLERTVYFGEERHSWREAVVGFLAEADKSLKPTVVTRYKSSLRQVDPILSPLMVDEIGNKHMAKIAGRKGASNATRRRDLTAVSAVLRWAVAQTWIETNVAKTWDRAVIRERRDAIELPSWVEIAYVIQRAPAMLGRLMLFLLQGGMRLEEVGGLTHRAAALNRGEITLTKTKSTVRTIRLTEAAIRTIRGTPRHISAPWVFWHDDGERYLNLSSRLREIKKRSGGKFRTHDLRHRFAVDYLRERRGSIYDLQQQLGHSSVKTTEIYLKYVGGEGIDDAWPFAPLHELSYEQIVALDLSACTNPGTVATVSRSVHGGGEKAD